MTPGGTVNFSAGASGNLSVSNTNGNVTIDVSKTPTFTSVTAGATTLDNSGISITGGGNGTVSLTNAGLNNGGNVLTNLAAGALTSGSTDAITGGQLYATNQATATALGTTLTNGAINAPSYSIAGQTYSNVGLALNALAGGAGNLVQQATPTSQITVAANTLGTSVNFTNSAGVNRTLTGLAAGALNSTSTDAVNGGQLSATNTALTNTQTTAASALGNGMTFNPNGTVNNAGFFLVGGHNYATAEAALSALGSGGVGPVQYSDALTPTTPNNGHLSQDLTLIGLAAGQTVALHNLSAGAAATDAVNVSQLTALATALGSTINNTSGNVSAPTYSIAGNTYNNVGTAITALTGGSTSAGVKYFHANSSLADSAPVGADAVAIGPVGTAAGIASVSMGLNASGAGNSAVAIGNGSVAAAANTIAIGTGNNVSGINSGAFGDPNVVTGSGSYAFGNNNTIAANNAFALGNNISIAAGLDGSVGIGDSSTVIGVHSGTFDLTGGTAKATSPSSVFSVGSAGNERQVQNVAAGVLNATSTDAVNGSQLFSVAQSTTALGNNLALTFGGSMVINPDGTISKKPAYTILGMVYNDVGSALQAINGNLGLAGGSGGITYFHANSVLADGAANGTDSVAIGPAAVANGASSVAMGNGTTANGANSVAIGAGATASGGGVALGSGTTATAGQVNVGALSVIGTGGASVTNGTNALTVNATQSQLASGSNTVTAAATGVTLAGGGTTLVVTASGVTLNSAKITGLAAGSLSAASTDAVNGSQLFATNQKIASLNNSVSSLAGGIAYDNTASAAAPSAAGANALAVGPGSTASGLSAAAVGNGSSASGTQSTALGNGALSAGTNSVALGAGSTDGGQSNVVSVGTSTTQRKIVNLAAGTIAANSTDAVNGSQLNTTNNNVAAVKATADGALQRSGGKMTGAIDMGGNSITNVAAPVNAADAANKAYVDSAVSGQGADIAALKTGLNDAFEKIDKATDGVALAIAMGGGFLSDNKKGAIWANYGNFQGKSAVAFDGYARLDNNWILGGSLGYSLDQRTIGTRVGIGYQW